MTQQAWNLLHHYYERAISYKPYDMARQRLEFYQKADVTDSMLCFKKANFISHQEGLSKMLLTDV